ncbi:putative DNA-binding WGR domain protein [Ereboglobus sp. PH5-5]|uniref:WGR and DUF4132 domain-containing protein n=1 Tax=Ereboglobus sp. PH5-5 TaxID=2940529 RepID=UPI002404D21D|nr:WGR and DUF4132 domain-containing protein [Ereboglobus sp. PH5-5]MDF9831870.1 putative DNA-binding WGR domain protein [Ereboglobus sp. PH5-5]
MTTRTFEFSDGSSNKFWTITLDGKAHTVNYGRIGTAGQTQTKEFASDSDAQKSFDKLVAEKTKKGYVEKTAGAPLAPVAPVAKKEKPAPVAAAKKEAVPAQPAAAPAAAPEPAPAFPTNAALRREIDLDAADWAAVPEDFPLPDGAVRVLSAALTPPPPAKPFDLEDCLKRLATKVRARSYGWEWDFTAALPDTQLSREEAEFWCSVMLAPRKRDEKPAERAEKIRKENTVFTGKAPAALDTKNNYVPAEFVRCLAVLLTPAELIEYMFRPVVGRGFGFQMTRMRVYRDGFRKYVFPWLTAAERAAWKEAAKAAWNSAVWPADFYATPPAAFMFGVMFGLRDEARALVEGWADNLYVADTSWDHAHYHCPQEIVLGLGTPELVAFHMRRLKLPLNRPVYIRGFLARTGLTALDVIARSIAAIGKKEDAEELFAEFGRVHAPEAAPHMLDLAHNSKAPRSSREWLDAHPAESVAGLIPVAAGGGKGAAAAVDYLNTLKRRGAAALIEAQLAHFPADTVARIRASVLDVVEKVYPALPPEKIPAWWGGALAAAPLGKNKRPAWVKLPDLTPLILDIAGGQYALGEAQLGEVIAALQASTPEQKHPLAVALREHAEADSLDAFGWRLFELWLGEGAPSKEKWAFLALGLLGGDRSVLKLAPLVRVWPGESQHQRAVTGLEVLRAIGTDTALMQINGIAQKVKFKGIKERAAQCMEAIAETRGMSRAQLEDRIVPDCGLDERGSRVFDFGPRQFRFILGPEMKPMIRHADGTIKSDLPKPGAKDDATLAPAAVAEWKLLKKQIAEVAKIQAVRLEQAMVTGRRWAPGEFQQLIVKQPLMINLARLLLWGVYDTQGKLTGAFRVTEDQTFADENDADFTLPDDAAGASIGLAHPLQMSGQKQLLDQWGQIFGDYEIVPPFAQLGRTIHTLAPEHAQGAEIKHLAARGKLVAQTLVFGLEKLGWQRGIPQDAGWVNEHTKQFPGADITAVINYDEGFSVGYWEGAGEQTIERVFFVPGLYTPRMYPDHKNAIPLAQVDALVLSEALNDCELLLMKAK